MSESLGVDSLSFSNCRMYASSYVGTGASTSFTILGICSCILLVRKYNFVYGTNARNNYGSIALLTPAGVVGVCSEVNGVVYKFKDYSSGPIESESYIYFDSSYTFLKLAGSGEAMYLTNKTGCQYMMYAVMYG